MLLRLLPATAALALTGCRGSLRSAPSTANTVSPATQRAYRLVDFDDQYGGGPAKPDAERVNNDVRLVRDAK
jgi:hypothetical protein